MADTQLVQPNFTATGTVGRCEEYVERVFGLTNVADCAWDAWLATPVKHYDRNFPTDVAVILYFSYTATIDGVTRNWGHVTVNEPGVGIHSSPYRPQDTWAILWSIEEVEAYYTTREDGGVQRVEYVGWSEYLANVKVAELQGDDMANFTKEQEQAAATMATGSVPGDDYNYQFTVQEINSDNLDRFLQFWQGQMSVVTADMEEMLAEMATGSPYGKDYNSQFQGKPVLQVLPDMLKFWLGQRQAPAAPVAPTTLKPGIYKVQ